MAEAKGGDKMGDVLGKMAEGLSKASSVEVGFLENATYPDGTSVAMVAALDEFGHGNTPARPYFRSMIAKHKGEWPKAIGDLLKDNAYDAAKTLAQVGAGVKGQLQQSIVDTTSPPLSKVTLMLRKMKAEYPDLVVSGKTVGEAAARVAAGESTDGVSTKPLVESGHLLNSADFRVE